LIDTEIIRVVTRIFIFQNQTTTATFADDTAISAPHEGPAIASMKFQATINKIDDWAKKWRNKINQIKSKHSTFTLCNQTCLTVQMNNVNFVFLFLSLCLTN
jgi:aspartate carbamoyltransferase regulatory subunit